MTNAAADADGPPPAPGLAPFDALRVVGDVQRQAVESASRVIGRFLDAAEAAADPAADPLANPFPGPVPEWAGEAADPVGDGFAQVRADMARAVDGYVELLRRTVDAYADLAEAALRRRGVTLAGPAAADAAAGLALVVGADGMARGTLWVHNTTDAAVAPGPVRVTDLCAYAGDVVPASRAVVEPPSWPPVPAGGSARATICVDVRGTPAGRYVGHALGGHGALALHVDVPGGDPP